MKTALCVALMVIGGLAIAEEANAPGPIVRKGDVVYLSAILREMRAHGITFNTTLHEIRECTALTARQDATATDDLWLDDPFTIWKHFKGQWGPLVHRSKDECMIAFQAAPLELARKGSTRWAYYQIDHP